MLQAENDHDYANTWYVANTNSANHNHCDQSMYGEGRMKEKTIQQKNQREKWKKGERVWVIERDKQWLCLRRILNEITCKLLD